MRFAVVTVAGKEYLTPEPLLKDLVDPTVISPPISIRQIPSLPETPINSQFAFSKELQSFLAGRELLLDELPYPLHVLHDHYQNGYIQYEYGIQFRAGYPHCSRCANQEAEYFFAFVCARCRQMCTYCRKCIMLGRLSQCTPLIRWAGPLPPVKIVEPILAWDGQLSAEQSVASDQLVQAIEKKTPFLIWAVCGAGKTEMLFQGIAQALARGRRVLLAAPRTDVITELTPRFIAAFPTTAIVSLYGGSDDRGKNGQLFLSTTHQLLRYRDYFDVIIVDEVDAFPYSIDQSLHCAVQKAQKEDGVTVFLTATPSKELKKLHHQKVPKRYHGYPLPVPEFQWCGNWKKKLAKRRLPQPLQLWLTKRLTSKKQMFLFVPTIEVGQQLVPIVRDLGISSESVHAEDEKRHEKVAKFRRGELQLLVTTTILERGVTVPNIDVAVLGAEEAIFTESALVQIAGRVGRHKDYPSGDIIFFHYGKTMAMVEAKRHIESMNEEGGFS
ncbi:DEAD/DEAH box helicase [Alkalihalobacterium alkalinitrilicum]|uniref:DEAD/DEAH box helicase n=1 Tax=Alkalihalobacterium alkalinitrilicum TaxID=427920 RepID=UPI000994A19C|nr:DEAD/DEAH box helicase [Alkalihalobacterium alkalinitrilicum]